MNFKPKEFRPSDELTIFESRAKGGVASESGVKVWKGVDAGLLRHNRHIGLGELLGDFARFVESPPNHRAFKVFILGFRTIFIKFCIQLSCKFFRSD